ncbi:MAG: aspartate/glutamate racemase family protein, partial [Reyranella sp.]|nr:aspartate/glutamate racemase family protein [Reyranella sp.]
MLDTRFPRIVGDIGNAASFDFPVIFRKMEGIGSSDAVTTQPDRPRVLAALKANAEALASEGAVGLSTSCGFL